VNELTPNNCRNIVASYFVTVTKLQFNKQQLTF